MMKYYATKLFLIECLNSNLIYLFLLNTKDLILRPIILIEHEYYKHINININKV